MRTILLLLNLLIVGLTTPGQTQDKARSTPTRIGPEIESALEEISELTYASYGDRVMKLDLYRPKEGGNSLPAIVCIHGGAWWKGERKNHAPLAKALASRGFVTATISYRLSGEKPFPAQIQDCKAAVRWLRANANQYGIDEQKIGATGLSAGGHLTALLATSGGVAALEGGGGNSDISSRIQAAVAMGAQTDLENERIRIRSKAESARFYPQFLGGTQEEVPAIYRLASPRHHLDEGDPPILMITGELDDPSTHAAEFRHDLKNLKIPTGLLVIEGAPHPFLTRQVFFDAAVDRAAAFFTEHLKQ